MACLSVRNASLGITGEVLLRLLECRLDNVAYRLGFGASRKEARQLVSHGHLTMNGRKINVPGAQVKAGDIISVRERSRTLISIQAALESVDGRGIPEWLELDKTAFKGMIRALPSKDQISLPVNEQMVVELYSSRCGFGDEVLSAANWYVQWLAT